MAKKKAKKRAKNYEPKLEVADNVTFDALMTVAVNYQPPKKEVKAEKPKKRKT